MKNFFKKAIRWWTKYNMAVFSIFMILFVLVLFTFVNIALNFIPLLVCTVAVLFVGIMLGIDMAWDWLKKWAGEEDDETEEGY